MNKKVLKIAKIRLLDFSRINHIISISSNPSARLYPSSVFTINLRETGHDGHDVSFLAIDPSGEVVGSAFAALEDGALRLDSIQANPPKRGLGIGSALLAAVIGWGRERGASHLTGEFKPDPFSRPADVERFYAKRGISVTPDGNLEGKLSAVQIIWLGSKQFFRGYLFP